MALLGFLKVRPIIKTETEVIWERISKNLISLAIISGALVSLVKMLGITVKISECYELTAVGAGDACAFKKIGFLNNCFWISQQLFLDFSVKVL